MKIMFFSCLSLFSVNINLNCIEQNEYLAPRDARRAFLTGFTGSTGTAIVSDQHACLWTDGRYFIQAANELDDNWTLMKEGEIIMVVVFDCCNRYFYFYDFIKVTFLGSLADFILILCYFSASEKMERVRVKLALYYCGLFSSQTVIISLFEAYEKEYHIKS